MVDVECLIAAKINLNFKLQMRDNVKVILLKFTKEKDHD